MLRKVFFLSGGRHFLPADGNLIFGDGETQKKIVLPMPKRVEYFNENEVAFYVCLGEPTGGATLSTAEAMIVLQNDIGEYLVETPNRCFTLFS